MGKLFCVGSSSTAGANDTGGGWVARLSGQIFAENVKAEENGRDFWCFPFNLGVPGDMVPDLIARAESEARARMEERLENENLQIIFSIGTNDSRYLVDEKRPMFSDEEFRGNLLSLIALAKGITANVSFQGLTPVDDSLLNPVPWRPSMAYQNERIRLFDGIIQSVCAEEGVSFLPMLEPFMANANWKAMLQDGLHPNSEGHAFMADRVKDFLFTDEFFAFHSEG